MSFAPLPPHRKVKAWFFSSHVVFQFEWTGASGLGGGRRPGEEGRFCSAPSVADGCQEKAWDKVEVLLLGISHSKLGFLWFKAVNPVIE